MNGRDGADDSAQRAAEALVQGIGAAMGIAMPGGGGPGHNFVDGRDDNMPPSMDAIASAFLNSLQTNEMPADLRDLLGGVFANVNVPEAGPPPRASREAIEGLEAIDASEADENECTICLSHFEAGERLKRLPCKHAFHGACVVPWLERHATCPVCRHALPTERPSARSFFDMPRPAAAAPPPPPPPAPEDLGALPVRELKRRLDALGVDYRGVIERSELVALLREHSPPNDGPAASSGAGDGAGGGPPSGASGAAQDTRGTHGDRAGSSGSGFSLASLMRMAAESQMAAEEERLFQEALRRSVQDQ